jgi:hypothetical protein
MAMTIAAAIEFLMWQAYQRASRDPCPVNRFVRFRRLLMDI